MAKAGKVKSGGNSKAPKKAESLAVAAKGISTGQDFANVMSALMVDVIAGRVSPGIANAACNAGGKLLKVVEMQMKFGTQQNGRKVLELALQQPLLEGKEQVQ